jgi:hypothetical protein
MPNALLLSLVASCLSDTRNAMGGRGRGGGREAAGCLLAERGSPHRAGVAPNARAAAQGILDAHGAVRTARPVVYCDRSAKPTARVQRTTAGLACCEGRGRARVLGPGGADGHPRNGQGAPTTCFPAMRRSLCSARFFSGPTRARVGCGCGCMPQRTSRLQSGSSR